MTGISRLIKDPDGLLYYGLASGYAVVAYIVGFVGLFQDSLLTNFAAMLLLSHGMTIAAYLIHECGHNLVFAHSRHNAALGRFMSWLCGAAYGTYEDMRYKHFRHHVDNDDVVWFDYDRFFEEHPLITRLTRVLEWLYIPAHDLIMHFIMAFTSFIIPLASQRKLYHRNRVPRVSNPQPDDYPKGADYLRSARAGRGPIGGNAASFLTSF